MSERGVPDLLSALQRSVEVARASRREENTHCAECGMLVGAAVAFHPFLYCRLFKLGVSNPAKFLEGQHFIPDPEHWGEGAPARQRDAAARP